MIRTFILNEHNFIPQDNYNYCEWVVPFPLKPFCSSPPSAISSINDQSPFSMLRLKTVFSASSWKCKVKTIREEADSAL